MTVFSRGPLTDAILDFLTAALQPHGILVGDGIAPNDGGWTGGQPGEGNFRSYVVVSTLQASKGFQDPVPGGDTSWRASYGLRSVGALRHQSDWTADKARQAMKDYKPKHIDLDGDWRVLKTSFETLGPVTRNDTSDPAYWELLDTATIWLEKHN